MEKRLADASVYQLCLRTFTPEGTLSATAKLLPFVSQLGPRYIQLSPVVAADEEEDRSTWSERQIASETLNPKNTYRIKDYFSIDAEYGDDADLHDFIRAAHRLGMGVILDLVYFHCGPNAVFLKEHPDFVKRNEDGSSCTGQWRFPVLNFDTQALREYLWKNMVYFVEEFDVDGYRCDVGDLVPLDFWEEGIKQIRSIKPDVFMLNEGSNPEYLSVFDANYFYDGCFDAVPVAQGKMTAGEFAAKWENYRVKIPEGKKLLHFIDNHDVASDCYENRHECSIGADGVEALLVMNFALDGVPFFFNGYEVADELKHNMFSNRYYGRDPAVNWANALCEKGQRRIQLTKCLFSLRNQYPAIASTALTWCEHSAKEQALVFIRPGAEDAVFAAINMTDQPIVIEVETVPRHLHMIRPIINRMAKWYFVAGKMHIQLLGFGYLVGACDPDEQEYNGWGG